MSRASRARRIALRAAYGGGGIGLLGAAFAALLFGQAKWANRAIPRGVVQAPSSSGLYGAQYATELAGEPLIFGVLGDSTAAGQGAEHAEQTVGARLATALADALKRPVQLICAAIPGSQSQHLYAQVDEILSHSPQLVAILVGANDILRRNSPSAAVRHLRQAVRRLREHNTEVVVGTCPDLSQIESIRPPLRWIVRRWCRELATAQTIAVVSAGGRTVSLADMLGDAFARRPQDLFSLDRFHPSGAGYALAAEAMLPSLLATLGYTDELAPAPSRQWTTGSVPKQGVRSLAHAAAEAAGTAGTEVAPVDEEEKPKQRGLWGELRNRLAWQWAR